MSIPAGDMEKRLVAAHAAVKALVKSLAAAGKAGTRHLVGEVGRSGFTSATQEPLLAQEPALRGQSEGLRPVAAILDSTLKRS